MVTMETKIKIKKLGFINSFAIYISAAILMYCLTKYLIPYLSEVTGQETILFWFIVAGLGIFVPLIITGIIILYSEGYKISKITWIERLRFRKITIRDLIWSIIGLILVGALSGIILKVLDLIVVKFDHSPVFMSFEPLTKERYWLLLIWFPFWILNILGEEFL